MSSNVSFDVIQQQGDLDCEIILPHPDNHEASSNSTSIPEALYHVSQSPLSKGPWSQSKYFAEIREALEADLRTHIDSFMGDWLQSQEATDLEASDKMPDLLPMEGAIDLVDGRSSTSISLVRDIRPRLDVVDYAGATIIQGLTPVDISVTRAMGVVHPTFFAHALAMMWKATEGSSMPTRTPVPFGEPSHQWHVVIRSSSVVLGTRTCDDKTLDAESTGSAISFYKDGCGHTDLYVVTPARRFRFEAAMSSDDCRLKLSESVSPDEAYPTALGETTLRALPQMPLPLNDLVTSDRADSTILDATDTTGDQYCPLDFTFDPKLFVGQAICYNKDQSLYDGCTTTLANFWDVALLNTCTRNLRHMNSDAKALAYREVLEPGGPDINVLRRWHTHRQCTASMIDLLTNVRSHRRSEDEASPAKEDLDATFNRRIATDCDEVLSEANALRDFLSDLGQVLIGTINVADANRSNRLSEQANHLAKQALTLTTTSNQIAEQANQFARSANDLAGRAMWLTFIAAVYLPLTLVTGIFGMNIKEINDGSPQWWACLAAFALIGTPSIAAATWIFMRDRRAKQLRANEMNDAQTGMCSVPAA